MNPYDCDRCRLTWTTRRLADLQSWRTTLALETSYIELIMALENQPNRDQSQKYQKDLEETRQRLSRTEKRAQPLLQAFPQIRQTALDKCLRPDADGPCPLANPPPELLVPV